MNPCWFLPHICLPKPLDLLFDRVWLRYGRGNIQNIARLDISVCLCDYPGQDMRAVLTGSRPLLLAVISFGGNAAMFREF